MPPDEIEPHVVRLREDAAGWRKVGMEGSRLTPDDPFLTGLSEDKAEGLVRTNMALVESSVDEARAFYNLNTPPFDPADYSVDDLEDALDEGDYSAAELDALADAEADGKDRTTALDAIEAARSDDE